MFSRRRGTRLRLTLYNSTIRTIFIGARTLTYNRLVILALVTSSNLTFRHNRSNITKYAIQNRTNTLIGNRRRRFRIINISRIRIYGTTILMEGRVFRFNKLTYFRGIIRNRILLFRGSFDVSRTTINRATARHFKQGNRRLTKVRQSDTTLSARGGCTTAFPTRVRNDTIMVLQNSKNTTTRQRPNGECALTRFY